MTEEGSSDRQAPQQPELTAITKAYDLVREMTRRVGKFPRDFRFLLGDRILRNVYDTLELLIEAKFSRDKVALLERANLRLEQVRFQVRLAHEEKLISTHQYEVAARLVDEVGRLVGGWRKSRVR
ncbi:MAG: diversity-generating retroelement protein Avd [Deltaproteobacteria bacterium]|nr:diversity-generating retroelement protein Avd [Deltaproteobacteria bacterium]